MGLDAWRFVKGALVVVQKMLLRYLVVPADKSRDACIDQVNHALDKVCRRGWMVCLILRAQRVD